MPSIPVRVTAVAVMPGHGVPSGIARAETAKAETARGHSTPVCAASPRPDGPWCMESADAAAVKAAAAPSHGVSPSKESPDEDGRSGDYRPEHHEALDPVLARPRSTCPRRARRRRPRLVFAPSPYHGERGVDWRRPRRALHIVFAILVRTNALHAVTTASDSLRNRALVGAERNRKLMQRLNFRSRGSRVLRIRLLVLPGNWRQRKVGHMPGLRPRRSRETSIRIAGAGRWSG
jgi:hypothetical protein